MAAVPAGFVPSLSLGQIRKPGNACVGIGPGVTYDAAKNDLLHERRRRSARPRQTRARIEAGQDGAAADVDDARPDARAGSEEKTGRDARQRKRDVTHGAPGTDAVSGDVAGAEARQNNGRKDPGRTRRTLSAESRSKISESLKGRRKSDTHRDSLSKRFTGSGNPMYGKKRSAETRAKISAALLARRREKEKKSGSDVLTPLSEDNTIPSRISPSMHKLKQQAIASRLVSSLTGGVRDRKKPCAADERIDKILKRVANLDAPPDNVVRLIKETEVKRLQEGNDKDEQSVGDDDEEAVGRYEILKQELPRKPQVERRKSKKGNVHTKPASSSCANCNGRGMTTCERCVGTFGVASIRCAACFGAGSVFCTACDGAGQIFSEL